MNIERRTLLRGLSALPVAGGVGGLSAAAASSAPRASVAAQVATADVPEDFPEPNRRLKLYAVELPADGDEVRLGYGLSPDDASYPGPTIEMLEGECIEITLHNQIPEETLEALRTDDETPIGASLHAHGVRYPHS